MNTSERIFKLQGQLSTWSGTKRIAGWLALVAVGISVIGVIFPGGETRIGALVASLPTFIICLFLRTQAEQKIREIRAELSS